MAKQLTLPSGRNLDYAIYGSPIGFPLVWHHGTPSAYKNEVPDLEEVCLKKDLKLITFSRAGYGGSSRNSGRRMADEVQDVRDLLDHLGEEKCFVGGWSGGGPPALACAARLRGCVAAAVVAALAPYDAEGLDFLKGQGEDNILEHDAAMQGEEALRAFCLPHREDLLESDFNGIIQAMSTLLPEVDKKALLETEGFDAMLVANLRESLKNGIDGWIDDDMSMLKSWGFELSEIQCPVFLYHGSEDKMFPYAHGKWIADHLPQRVLTKHLLEGEGHISVLIGRVESLVDELCSVPK